jgi:hypothetical protein
MKGNYKMSENMFTKPERPFFLMAEDEHGEVSYFWLETEEELIEVAKEITSNGLTITDSVEIGSVREIKL